MASPKKRVNPLLIVLLAVLLLAAAVAVGVVFAKLHSKVTTLQSGASFTLRYPCGCAPFSTAIYPDSA